MTSYESKNNIDEALILGLKVLGRFNLDSDGFGEKMIKKEASDAGFDDLQKYWEYLDFKEFEEDEEKRAQLKMTRESYLKWKYRSEDEDRTFEVGILAIIENNKIESLRVRTPKPFYKEASYYDKDIDEESIIMTNLSKGNGDLHGL